MLVATVTLAIGAVAVLASLQREPSFRSEAKVLVKPISFDSGEAPGVTLDLNMATEEELVQSPLIVDIVLRRLGSSATAQELIQELDVTESRNGDAQILVMTYAHPDPVVAQERAEEFASAYIGSRRAGALADVRRQTIVLRSGISLLESRSVALLKQAKRSLDPVLSRFLQRQAEQMEGLALERRIMLSLPRQEPDVGSVVQAASAPVAAYTLGHLTIGVVGLLIGLLAGMAVAAISTMDDRPADSTELESSIGAPVVVSIPRARVRGHRKGTRAITLSAPRSAAADAYRVLRAVVDQGGRDGSQVFFVTSADAGEGKSTIGANLAVSLAEGGLEVVLVDCNPRRPTIHDLFRTEEAPGLVHVLAGTAGLGEALRPTSTDRLTILAAGRRSDRSTEILSSPRMRTVIAELSSAADLVILDGPAVRGGPDALALVPVSDAVVFVADALIGDNSAVAEARHRLEGVEAELCVAVLNNAPKAARQAKYRRRTLGRSRVVSYGA